MSAASSLVDLGCDRSVQLDHAECAAQTTAEIIGREAGCRFRFLDYKQIVQVTGGHLRRRPLDKRRYGGDSDFERQKVSME